MRRRQSGRIALCGVMCGLSIVLMLSGSIIPFATFCAPAMSGLLLMPVAVECGMRLAWVCYGAISALAVLFVPDKEMAAIFVFLFGCYPLLKAYIQRIPGRGLQFLVKAGFFNGTVLAMYGMLLFIFPMPSLVEEFAQTAQWMLAALLVMGNVCFWIYDVALNNVLHVYVLKMQPRLRRML